MSAAHNTTSGWCLCLAHGEEALHLPRLVHQGCRHILQLGTPMLHERPIRIIVFRLFGDVELVDAPPREPRRSDPVAPVGRRVVIEEEALEAFGMNLGLAFQIIDDVLDYSAKKSDLGKEIGDDFKDGKLTLPIILAYRRGTDEERIFWRRTIEKQEFLDGDLDHALKLLDKNAAISDSIERACHFGSVARDALGIFPETQAKAAFIESIDFAIGRAH